jgi:hypothetical protein
LADVDDVSVRDSHCANAVGVRGDDCRGLLVDQPRYGGGAEVEAAGGGQREVVEMAGRAGSITVHGVGAGGMVGRSLGRGRRERGLRGGIDNDRASRAADDVVDVGDAIPAVPAGAAEAGNAARVGPSSERVGADTEATRGLTQLEPLARRHGVRGIRHRDT